MTLQQIKDKATASELALIEMIETMANTDAEKKLGAVSALKAASDKREAKLRFLEKKLADVLMRYASEDRSIRTRWDIWLEEFETNYKP